METGKLKGRRCIALIRVRRAKQAKNGLPQQASWLRSVADKEGMIWVDERKESLGVSQTTKRPDLDYLMARKKLKDDFDTIYLQDLSRLTRGGLEHGFDVYKMFKNAGILIATVLDGLIDSEDKLDEALKKFKEARAAMKLTAMFVSRGLTQSRTDGRSAYTKQLPFGVDGRISDKDGTPLFILRNRPNGTQQQLDPKTFTLMRTFSPNEDGVCRHYVRQDGDFVDLVMGAPEAVKIVRQIFRRKFVDGWGLSRITRELNDQKAVAPKGGDFSRSTVRSIYQNSCYVGKGVMNRQATGVYWRLGNETQPSPLADQEVDAKHSLWMNTHRPESEWVVQPCPELTNMLDTGLEGFPEPCLDPAMKEHVEQWQFEEMRRLATKQIGRRGGDKHGDNEFLLKHILRSKQGNHKMAGRSFTRKQYSYRYYAISKGRSNPVSGSLRNRLIPADVLEDEVLKAVQEAVTSYDGIEDVVRATIDQQLAAYKLGQQDRPKLLRERERVDAQIDFWAKQIVDLGEDFVTTKTKALTAQLADVQRQLAQTPVAEPPMLVEEVMESVKRRCAEFASAMDKAEASLIRQVLHVLVRRMEVDLETREVELELGLPSWSLASTPLRADEFCLDNPIARIVNNEAEQKWSIPLARFTCTHERISKTPCWTCRRTLRVDHCIDATGDIGLELAA
jgi:hypothetical protein